MKYVELLTRGASMLAAYAPKYLEIPLPLGLKPVWSAGPNTHVSTEKDSIGSQNLGGVRKVGIWHTLPVDASALLTLWTPEF